MNISPSGNGGSNPGGDPQQYGLSLIRGDNTTTNSIRGHSNTNVGNVSHSYNRTINVGGNEAASRIQAWLSPLEPHRRHRDVSNHRLDGVGDWVLRESEFESWHKSQDGSENVTLRCYGGQGVGKTYISSLVIDTLSEQAQGHNMAILFLYCDYQAQKDQSAANMIGGLLRQVTVGKTGIRDEIQSAFKGPGQGGDKFLRLSEMVELFLKVISSMERVYICVDAVDELLPHVRSEFLRALQTIVLKAPNARLFLTGRPYIRREFDKYLTEGAYTINIVANQGDIARYISRKMDDDDAQNPDLMTEDLTNEIMKTLLDKASEMFLLIALNIETILGETSLARRRKMLQKVAAIGVDLDSVYTQTLRRIKEQKGDRSRLGMEVLMWVSHAERPLRIDELCHALAVEMGSKDLDPENIRPQDTVLGSCLGLAVVDEGTSTVRLIHYTLQEFLSQPSIMDDPHKTLARSCLTYLNHEVVNRLPVNRIPSHEDMPFLRYSSSHWGDHAKVQLCDDGKLLAHGLLRRYDKHISATSLLDQIPWCEFTPRTHHPFTGLHCASYFGINVIVAALMELEGCDINQKDCMGFTPLMWAAQQGNQGVVRLLLARDDINPDKPDNDGQTPLRSASRNGHEGVVRLLLARDDINPDKPDNYGRTPLWWASRNGHEGVVRLLLARDDINPDKPNIYGRTPLWWASRNGHEGVVRLLLARDDVRPDMPDNAGRTPLDVASQQGGIVIVALLQPRTAAIPSIYEA